MNITGEEASLLLFALDGLVKTNQRGQITAPAYCFTIAETQDLRDRLFAAHKHKDEAQ